MKHHTRQDVQELAAVALLPLAGGEGETFPNRTMEGCISVKEEHVEAKYKEMWEAGAVEALIQQMERWQVSVRLQEVGCQVLLVSSRLAENQVNIVKAGALTVVLVRDAGELCSREGEPSEDSDGGWRRRRDSCGDAEP